MKNKETGNKKEQQEIFRALGKEYLNLFLINAKTGMARILKLDGYVTSSLEEHKTGEEKKYSYEDVCRQYIKERVHPEEQTDMLEKMALHTIKEALNEKTEYVDSYRTLTDGETHYYRFKYMWLNNTGQIIAGFQNIDEIVLKEKKNQDRLSEALEKAEQASRAKTEFLNGISHDIRTPLNAILGFTRLARNQLQENPAVVDDYLKKVEVSGRQLLSLINDVLDLSHIESGKVRIKKEMVYLPELFEELFTILRGEMERKKHKFVLDTSGMAHEEVVTDRLRLSRILLNILSNAVKFTESGGMIGFSVMEKTHNNPTYRTYEFRIKDTGIGMSKEFQEHIFESFAREQTSTISGVEGSGLGMAIAKNYIDLLDGTIRVKSQPRNGTEFLVSLPMEICEEMHPGGNNIKDTAEEEKYVEIIQEKMKGKPLLLVEDNLLNQEIAEELLTQAGLEVDTAENGKEALEKLLAGDTCEYAFVLMDIQMPVMDGYTATKTIRQMPDPQISQIPIFALSANAFQEDREKAEKAGMNGYLSKPVHLPELLKTIANVL